MANPEKRIFSNATEYSTDNLADNYDEWPDTRIVDCIFETACGTLPDGDPEYDQLGVSFLTNLRRTLTVEYVCRHRDEFDTEGKTIEDLSTEICELRALGAAATSE